MNLLERLRTSFGLALPEGADRAAFAKAVRPATDPKFGDYQANGAWRWPRRSGKKPRDIADEIVGAVDLSRWTPRRRSPGPGSSTSA